MKKVGFAAGEVVLLRRLMRERLGTWSKADDRAATAVLNKLDKAEMPNDPGVNAPAIEEALLTYSSGKVVALSLPNWQRYARQGAQCGATVADAQIIGQWMALQGWLQPGSQTLQSVLNNWSSWLGKAKAQVAWSQAPKAGLNGHAKIQAPSSAGNGTQTSEGSSASRPAPGLGQRPKIKPM